MVAKVFMTWRERHNQVHNDTATKLEGLADSAHLWLTEFRKAKAANQPSTMRRNEGNKTWLAPPYGSFKLNVDAAIFNEAMAT